MAFRDGMQNVLGGFQYVQEQQERGEEKRRVGGLRALAGDYYGQQSPMLGQIARLGGDAAGMQKDMQAQGMQKAKFYAGLLLNTPKELRGQVWDSQIAPGLNAAGLPVEGPYRDEYEGIAQQLVGEGEGKNTGIQSTFVDTSGNRVGVTRDGRTVVLGQNAPQMQILEGQGGYFGVNKGSLHAAPVTMGGQMPPQAPQQPAAPAQGTNDGVLAVANQMAQAGIPAEMIELWMAKQPGIQPVSQQAPGPQGGGQLQPAEKPITPYQQQTLAMRQQATQAAQEARDAALAARKDAAGLKANQAQQALSQRQAAAVETADGLVRAIDTLTGNPGFGELGTVKGDLKQGVPLIRSDVKDAQAQLKNIAGQVALATMSKLKALSSQGATGFGALSAQELRLLENSIATLQSEQISNQELGRSLKVIRDSMTKITAWKAPAAPSAPGSEQGNASGWSLKALP